MFLKSLSTPFKTKHFPRKLLKKHSRLRSLQDVFRTPSEIIALLGVSCEVKLPGGAATQEWSCIYGWAPRSSHAAGRSTCEPSAEARPPVGCGAGKAVGGDGRWMNGGTKRKGCMLKTGVSVDDRWVISGSVCLIHLRRVDSHADRSRGEPAATSAPKHSGLPGMTCWFLTPTC